MMQMYLNAPIFVAQGTSAKGDWRNEYTGVSQLATAVSKVALVGGHGMLDTRRGRCAVFRQLTGEDAEIDFEQVEERELCGDN